MIVVLRTMASAIFPALAIVACSGGDSTGVVGRDSAGVHIVVSEGAGTWTEVSRPAWKEVSRVRQIDRDTNYQFGNIVGADLGADGTIYVLDMPTGRVRAFDSAGTFLRGISRKGTGPGEIGPMASGLLVTAGDTIVVLDAVGQKATTFSSDGATLGTFDTPFADGLPVKWQERHDGTIVVQVRQINMNEIISRRLGGAGAQPDGATLPGDQLQIRSTAGKVLDTLLTLPAGETLQMGGEHGMRAKLFAPEPIWTNAQDGRVFFGVNSEYSVNVYDAAGTLAQIVRRAAERAPVTEADKAAILDAMKEQMKRMGIPAQTLETIGEMYEFAEFFPAIGNILGGPDGTLWVQQALAPEALRNAVAEGNFAFGGSPSWDVYRKDGALLGTITMPGKFTALQWVRDKLIGVQTDENDVQNIVVFTLSGGTGAG